MEINFTILGNPVTKKNSQQIVYPKRKKDSGFESKPMRPIIVPSKNYKNYEQSSLIQLAAVKNENFPIDFPIEIQCIYYMENKRRVDLNNLLEATDDILTRAGILSDDNSAIVASHDGSRVYYDKDNPRVDVYITDNFIL